MGLHFLGSRSKGCNDTVAYSNDQLNDLGKSSGKIVSSPVNPDPKNFKILAIEQKNGYILLEVKYPDCNNYEGKKILLYKHVTLAELILQGSLDPHFAQFENYHSPIARFEPTHQGWRMGIAVMELDMSNN